MLSITWKKGPNLPQGFQDSDGGIINNTLITVGGFCQGTKSWANQEQLDAQKPGVYPRGFLQKAWGLDLQSPQAGWQSLPDFPGAARQELFSIAVNDQLYCFGGFSYTDPYCYNDGYRLSKQNDTWIWNQLPSLPWPVASSGICAIGSHIYAVGGADYNAEKLFTNADRNSNNARLGSRLLVLDTNNLAAGWQERAACPGTPRMVQAMAAVGGKIYVVGGATGNDNATGNYATVVDNWQYDPTSNQWSRIRDMPVSTGNFPSGNIVYNDRYVLLVGGAQYAKVIGPDGSTTSPYGTVSKFYPDNPYNSDVFVYDTQTNLFGTATGLPLNNNLPMTVVSGNRIHLIGGETGGCTIEGELYGHHPELYLVGTIQTVPEPGSLSLLGVATAIALLCGWLKTR
jgi:N-acetylneuraminic acid mutarotase